VYIIYARFYEIGFDDSGLEFVLAVLKDFIYDYESEALFSVVSNEVVPPQSHKTIDVPEPNMKIKKVYRKLDTYGDAAAKLSKKILQKKDSKTSKKPKKTKSTKKGKK